MTTYRQWFAASAIGWAIIAVRNNADWLSTFAFFAAMGFTFLALWEPRQ